MSKVNVYSAKKSVSQMEFPKEMVNEVNLPLLAQAMHVYRNRVHRGLSSTKDRGDVQATTKKIYRQKGTGNARHGARTAPIFVGGGVAHGPDGRKKTLTLPEKMKKRAWRSAVGLKLSQKQVGVVDGVGSLTKTKEAQELLDVIEAKGKKTVVIALANREKARYFRNLSNVSTLVYPSVDTYTLASGGYLVFDKDIFEKAPMPKKEKAK